MSQAYITETILRDAHQCLIATRMRTEDMLPACERLDRVGFWSLEVWGGATFDACLRFLKEDPWDRLRQLRAALPNTRLQMLLRGQNLVGYRHYSDDVVRAFVAKAAANGIDVFRVFDALNDTRNLKVAIDAVKAAGRHAQGCISYTVSPVHTIAAFTEQAQAMEAMGCDSIAIKDMAGLLTPTAAAELTASLHATLGVPIHVHSHATSGLSEMCHLKALEQGARGIDTAISAFAGGASHAPTESMVAALAGTDHDTGLDLELLQEIGFYFNAIRKKYHQFESEFTGLDTRVQTYQVPGGMISNMINQLRDQGALDKLPEVLAEIPRVREELGYPPLVTPTSQIVGTQATLNVIVGERYKTITNEVKAYLQGRYGRAPGEVDPLIQQKAIGHADIITARPADLLPDEMANLTAAIGELAHSEEDVLSYAMFPEIGRDFLAQRQAGTLTPEALEPAPVQTETPAEERPPEEFKVTLHGETYHVHITGAGHKHNDSRSVYLSIDGMPEEIVVETLGEFAPPKTSSQQSAGKEGSSQRPPATQPGHVGTSMPGTIVDVLVAVGDQVAAGDPILITEAMKMETEIQAPVAGEVSEILVAKGENVNPDETLVVITEN